MNNKYVWRGKSAIIFNVRLNDLFEINDNDINLKDLYQGMTDLGYAFKSNNSTTWTYRSIKRFSVPTITSLNDLISDELLQKDTAYYNRYAPQYGHIYPFKILLKKDELPSTFKINIGRYYRIRGNETIDYQLEVSLLPDAVNLNDISSVSYVPFNFPSSVGEINLGEFKKGLDDAIEIMNIMTNLNYEFTPSIIETSNPQEAANSKMEFNIRFQDAWLDKNYVRSLVIHEIAHNFLNKNFPSTEELKQKVNAFMEFVTGIDGATWQWLGNHNYPVIDGNNYSYIEDCLVAAACLLVKENSSLNTDVNTKLKSVPKYVDMGLSVCWAEWNIGALEVNDFGLYFGWGDISGNMISTNPYDYAVGFNMTSDSFAGDPKYDAAALHWGGKWRMPTEAELLELAENSTWTHEERLSTTGESISGFLVTSKISGNSIFLPAGGYYEGIQSSDINSSALYWSANFDTSENSNLSIYFHIDDTFSRETGEKYKRILIRPVWVPDVQPLEPSIPDTIDPEDDTIGTPSLDLRVVGISTDNHILLNTELNNTNIALSGAGSMVIHMKSEHTGGIISSNCVLIDNFGYFIERTDGYGKWPGGTTNSTTRKEITFSTVNTPKVDAKMTVMSTVDEDNHTLLRGDMCSKAIRVPAAGTSSSISVSKYPYDFASPLFFTPMVICPVYIDPVTNKGSLGSYVEKTYSTDGFSATIQEGNTVLDNVISYSISTNRSNKYKEYILYITPLYENYLIGEPYGYDGVMLHFIQEPLVKNRVYYGSGFSASKTFSDKNYNNPSGFEYHAFFETANSKILKKEFTLSVKEGNYCAWPNDGDYNMDFGATQYDIVKVNYMWGNQSYTVARINSYMGNVQFKKKG